MEETLAIDFSDALAQLQDLLGHRVRAFVNVHGIFAGCVIEGELERVETLPPDNRAVNLMIAAHQGIVLDPEDVEVLLVADSAGGQDWLEFHLLSGCGEAREGLRLIASPVSASSRLRYAVSFSTARS